MITTFLLLHFFLAAVVMVGVYFKWGGQLAFKDQVTIYLTLLIPVVGEVLILIELSNVIRTKKS